MTGRTTLRWSLSLIAVVAAAGCSFRGGLAGADPTSSGGHSTTAGTATSGGSTPATGAAAPVAEGSGSGTSSAAGAPRTTPASGAGTDRCHTSELTGHLAAGSPGAGQRYATLTLTDTGGQTCTIDGYGGLGLVGSGGQALPTRQVRVASPGPRLVTLHPGQAVAAQLHWGAVAGSGDSTSGNCQPVATSLQVIPPDETDALSIPWTMGPVCEQGEIMQKAYAAA